MGKLISDQPDEILSIDEVAAYLKAGKRTFYCLAASCELDKWIACRIGKVMGCNDGGAE